MGIGNALMDLLVEVDDSTLIDFNLQKGEMHLVDHDHAEKLLSIIIEKQLKIEVVPGGSVANTLKGISLFGGHTVLCGKVGRDKHGEMYIQEMEKIGVRSNINGDPAITGHALTLVTPDSQRTFSVHLGAAVQLNKADILEEDIAKSKVLHLEGYQLEGNTRETILFAIELAKQHGTLVSLDLADPGVIRRNKEFLTTLIQSHVDIVFMNELEAQEFTGFEELNALMKLPERLTIAVVKLGAKGSLIRYKGEVLKIPAMAATPLDTTGAGDSYAAGLLYGFTKSWDMQKSARLGSLLAAKVIEQMGVRIHDISAETLFTEVEEQMKGTVSTPSTAMEDSCAIKVGIIGGSGIDSPDILENKEVLHVETKWGNPSSPVTTGTIGGVDVAIIARHGPGHILNPTNVPYRANIAALKKVGCTHIIAATAVGSLQEEYKPGDIVIADQFIDRTTKRNQTFYDGAVQEGVCHITVAEPMCGTLRTQLIDTANRLGLPFHDKGTCVVIEGPRFSTKAESHLFRQWKAEIIGMTMVPEVVLAREMEIPYANISMVTDYDVWREGEEVSTEKVIETMKANVEKVKLLLKEVIPQLKYDSDNPIRSALKGALF